MNVGITGILKRRHFGPTVRLAMASVLKKPIDTALTVVLGAGLVWVGWRLVHWAIIAAVGVGGSAQECRSTEGACWAAIGTNLDLLLFGTYPAGERWRAGAALAAIIITFGLLSARRLRKAWVTIPLYLLSFSGVLFLLLGTDWSGLGRVDADIIGGLTLTFFISWIALPLALPFALALALARQSSMPAVRVVAVSYIEFVRGLPLIVVLFMAAVLFPLFLDGDVTTPKVFRAILGIAIFASAYFAEIIRGGLQAVSGEQVRAAESLGLRYWQIQFLVVLPQIVPIIMRPLSGMIITFFKNTSLISVIGLFEITGIANVVITKPEWAPFSTEIYLAAGAVYISCCFAISRLASDLEDQFGRFRNR